MTGESSPEFAIHIGVPSPLPGAERAAESWAGSAHLPSI